MYNHPDPYLGYSSSMAWDATRQGSGRRSPLPNRRQSSRYSDSLLEEKTTPTTTPATPQPRPSATRNPALRRDPPLLVGVVIRFADPKLAPSTYAREYRSSAAFEPTERITRGLLRRIQHGTEELITRKDSTALDATHGPDQQPKAPRYEMTFHVARNGVKGTDQTFRSYQKQPVTSAAARDVILSSHRIVGLFLKRHDRGFRWAGSPFPDDDQPRSEVSKPGVPEPLSLDCVPRSRFLEASQTFESTPGYSIEFTFTSRRRCRKQHEWRRAVKLESRQNTPLNLALSEELLWRTSKAVNDRLDARRKDFYEEHRSCEWLEGVVSCQHFDKDALDIQLRITNHLGPEHSHLRRNVQTRLGLFRHPEGLDCQSFVRDVHTCLVDARDDADDQIAGLPDLDFRILRLQGKHWKVENPAGFRLGSSTSYSRRTTEAILDRLRTGIADVLRGNDVAIHVSAYKRGHLILDKAIIAHATTAKGGDDHQTLEEEQAEFVSQLKARIQEDLDRITKDTCSLEDIPPQELHNTPTRISPHQLSADVSEDPASRCSSPEPRIFALVPRKYSARVGRRISDIQEALASATRSEFDVKEPASPAFVSIADLSRPSTPALSADADASLESSLLATPGPPRAEVEDALGAWTPGSEFLEEPREATLLMPDALMTGEEGKPPLWSDDPGDGGYTEGEIMSPATASIGDLDMILDVADGKASGGGSDSATEEDDPVVNATRLEPSDKVEPFSALDPVVVPISGNNEGDDSQGLGNHSTPTAVEDESSNNIEAAIVKSPNFDDDDAAAAESEVTDAQGCGDNAAISSTMEEESSDAFVAGSEEVDAHRSFEEDFARTKPDLDIEDVIDLDAEEFESDSARDMAEEAKEDGDDEDNIDTTASLGTLAYAKDDRSNYEDEDLRNSNTPLETPSGSEDPLTHTTNAGLEPKPLGPSTYPAEVHLNLVDGEDDVASCLEAHDTGPALSIQPGSRSVSGSTLVSSVSAHSETDTPWPSDKPISPSQVLKPAGWPGFADVPAKRASLLASTHLLLSRRRTNSSAEADAAVPSPAAAPPGAAKTARDSVETLVDEACAPSLPDPRPRSVATAGCLGLHDYALDTGTGFLKGPARGADGGSADGGPTPGLHRRARSAVLASLGFPSGDALEAGRGTAPGKRWSVFPELQGLGGGPRVKDGVMPRVVMMVASSRAGRYDRVGE